MEILFRTFLQERLVRVPNFRILLYCLVLFQQYHHQLGWCFGFLISIQIVLHIWNFIGPRTILLIGAANWYYYLLCARDSAAPFFMCLRLCSTNLLVLLEMVQDHVRVCIRVHNIRQISTTCITSASSIQEFNWCWRDLQHLLILAENFNIMSSTGSKGFYQNPKWSACKFFFIMPSTLSPNEYLLFEPTFDPCQFLLDNTFKGLSHSLAKALPICYEYLLIFSVILNLTLKKFIR